ncbi:RNF31 ligase, partial [Cettia cetti]|nr:RNF31 ligase [Cettia cetti]
QPSPAPSQAWPCPRCTFLNPGHAPSCDVCGTDHAPSDDITITETKPTSGSGPAHSSIETSTSCSGQITSGSETGTSCLGSASSALLPVTSGLGLGTSGFSPAPSRDALRQRKLREDGRRVVALVRAAESQGLPPESLGPAPFSQIPEASGPSPDLDSLIRHFRSHLRGVLKALQEEGPKQEVGGASLGPFSLAEAAWAWLEGDGDFEHARRVLIGRRKQQLHLLSSLGFPEPGPAAAALQRQQGSHWGALQQLQQHKLR